MKILILNEICRTWSLYSAKFWDTYFISATYKLVVSKKVADACVS